MRTDLIRSIFATRNIWFFNGWLDSGAMFGESIPHLYLCICICVVAYLCICNGWLDAGAMFVESLPHLKVAQHCVAAFPNIVSPTTTR